MVNFEQDPSVRVANQEQGMQSQEASRLGLKDRAKLLLGVGLGIGAIAGGSVAAVESVASNHGNPNTLSGLSPKLGTPRYQKALKEYDNDPMMQNDYAGDRTHLYYGELCGDYGSGESEVGALKVAKDGKAVTFNAYPTSPQYCNRVGKTKQKFNVFLQKKKHGKEIKISKPLVYKEKSPDDQLIFYDLKRPYFKRKAAIQLNRKVCRGKSSKDDSIVLRTVNSYRPIKDQKFYHENLRHDNKPQTHKHKVKTIPCK